MQAKTRQVELVAGDHVAALGGFRIAQFHVRLLHLVQHLQRLSHPLVGLQQIEGFVHRSHRAGDQHRQHQDEQQSDAFPCSQNDADRFTEGSMAAGVPVGLAGLAVGGSAVMSGGSLVLGDAAAHGCGRGDCRTASMPRLPHDCTSNLRRRAVNPIAALFGPGQANLLQPIFFGIGRTA